MTLKLKTIILAIVIITPLSGLLITAQASAADPVTALKPSDCSPPPPSAGVSEIGPNKGKVCKKDPATCPGYSPSNKDVIDPKDDAKCIELGNTCDQKTGICPGNPIIKDLNDIVKVLSGLVGVVVVGVIILGGIQYSMAGDKAEAVSAAKKRIINGVTALVAFLFIFAFLQWLIPGGIFS